MRRDGPLISLIWAMAENRVIGNNNRLPWHLPADLRHFKQLTLGKPILMGRKTWESLPGLLPNRHHLVMTRDRDYRAEHCTIVHSMDEMLNAVRGASELMVVGGADLYTLMLPLADRLYMTLVHAKVDGDTRFPEIDLSQWNEIERVKYPADEKNRVPYSFVILRRKEAI